MILKAPIMLSLLSLCLLPWASAAPSPSTFTPQVKEVFNAPRGWRRDGLPTPDHTVELQIGLRQPNFHVLEQHLYEVSDPDHPRYGQHLSKEQVDELVAPHDESLALVTEWLGMYGVDSDTDIGLSSARDWIRVSLPVSVVEEMLDTTYHVWKHDDGTSLVRTTSYSLPEHLHSHVDVVQPTTLFGRWKTMRSTIVESFVEDPIENAWNFVSNTLANGEVDPACNRSITVDCLLQLYNITDFTPSHPDNSIAVTGYLEQYANEADLQSFYRDQLPEAVGSSFEVISVKGGINDQNISNAGIEANLDVQFAFGVAYPIPGTFYTIAGRPPIIPENSTTNTNEPYNDWLDFILAQENPPKVISTSYGEPEQTVPFSYAQRACQGFAQLGARGVTVTFSSGDGGVGDGNPDPATQECIVFGTNTTRFQPLFPAGCPYVTAIGGTVNVPEMAVDFSGGGFSDYFARPSYQDDVVPGYINSLAPGTYTGLFNTSGRGIPDIAAEGRRFRVWYQGRTISVGGTSASSPVAAAIFALLNDIRLSKGQSTLGFVNPLLYKQDVSAAFNDITIGNNPGCGTDGFNATVGWDPITGFGTPNFGLLRELV